MKKNQWLIPILSSCVILFNISCQRKLSNSITEKIRIDTIRDYKVITKYNAVHDTLIIENPCDSLGFLTRFYSKITIPQGQVIIRSYKGSIKATVNLDSISQVYDRTYKSLYQNNSKTDVKVIIKEVIPMWVIITIIFETFIIFGYMYIRIFKPF